MQTDSNLKLEKLLVDGGMTKNDLLMQIQADFLGMYFNTFLIPHDLYGRLNL